MPAKKHKPEEIIGKLRQVEIVLGEGGTAAVVCRRIAVSEQTYYRWRKEYGGLKTDQVRRIQRWLRKIGVKTLYIAPGSLWENGSNESFNGSLRNELPYGKIFYSLAEAKVLDRGMAASSQYRPSAQQPRLLSAGLGSVAAAIAGLRFRFAPPTPGNGGGDDNALTNNPDHPVGATQSSRGRSKQLSAFPRWAP